MNKRLIVYNRILKFNKINISNYKHKLINKYNNYLIKSKNY